MTESATFNWKPWLLVTLVVFVLDQLTKHWILANMALYDSFEVFSFFNIVHVHNYGAAFSFLSDQPGWQRWFLTGITTVISIVLLVWLTRLKASEKLLAIALVFVLGGALGNLYDRVVYGYVVDFIDWHYGGYHWPAFNLADAAIFLGAVLLIVDTFTQPGPDSAKETKS
jgi:signal peptidase II